MTDLKEVLSVIVTCPLCTRSPGQIERVVQEVGEAQSCLDTNSARVV